MKTNHFISFAPCGINTFPECLINRLLYGKEKRFIFRLCQRYINYIDGYGAYIFATDYQEFYFLLSHAVFLIYKWNVTVGKSDR